MSLPTDGDLSSWPLVFEANPILADILVWTSQILEKYLKTLAGTTDIKVVL